MPFCPSCRQEFEPFAARCPDCEVTLVEALDAGGGGSGLSLTLVLAETEAIAERMEAVLARARIPTRRVPDAEGLPDGHVAVLVPGPVERQALGTLDADPALERGTALISLPGGDESSPVPRYRRAGAATALPAAVADPDLLRAPVRELVAKAGDVIVPLLEFVRHGTDPERDKSIRALVAMGAAGQAALARQLAVLVRDGREPAVYAAARELKDRLVDADALADVVAAAEDAGLDVERRCLALHALGRVGRAEVHPAILDLLEDDDPEVRDAADEALCSISDEDMGFDPEHAAAARAEVVERWRVWFSRQRR